MTTSAPSTCPEGFGPDLLYRFPMEPFFPQQYGTDCFFSRTGYTIFAAIIIVCAAVCLLLFIGTLPMTDNRLLRVVKYMHLVTNINVINAMVAGLVRPEVFHFFFMVMVIWFVFTAWTLIVLGYYSIIHTIAKVEIDKQITVTNLVGGSLLGGILTISYIGGCALAILGAIGVSVSAAQSYVANATLYNRIQNAGLTLATVAFIVAMHKILTKFVSLIERSANATAEGEGNSNNASKQAKVSEMRDIAQRFRLARNMLDVCAAIGVIFCALLTAILPTFWFVAQMIALDFVVGAFGVFYGVTSRKQRRKILSVLIHPTRMVKLGQQSSAKSETVAPARNGATGTVTDQQQSDFQSYRPDHSAAVAVAVSPTNN